MAGPIGGTDIRSAIMPLPGLYGGGIGLVAGTIDFLDRNGDVIPALKDAQLHKELVGPFLYYVPKVKVLGGAIGFGGIVPGGNQAFKFIGTQAFHKIKGERRCKSGIVQGDVNGDGKADFEIKVNLTTLVKDDFFL